eukprot:1420479-Prymnesium_polylepis.2
MRAERLSCATRKVQSLGVRREFGWSLDGLATLTLPAEGDRQLGLAVPRLARMAIGAACGHLQRAEALAAVRLRAGEPHTSLTLVGVGPLAALAEIAGHLVNRQPVLRQPASPLRMQARLRPAVEAPAEACVPPLALRQPLLHGQMLLVRLTADAHVKMLRELVQPARARLEPCGHLVSIQRLHRLLHHHFQDVAGHFQPLAPLLAVEGVHLGLGHRKRTDGVLAQRAPASGTRGERHQLVAAQLFALAPARDHRVFLLTPPGDLPLGHTEVLGRVRAGVRAQALRLQALQATIGLDYLVLEKNGARRPLVALLEPALLEPAFILEQLLALWRHLARARARTLRHRARALRHRLQLRWERYRRCKLASTLGNAFVYTAYSPGVSASRCSTTGLARSRSTYCSAGVLESIPSSPATASWAAVFEPSHGGGSNG